MTGFRVGSDIRLLNLLLTHIHTHTQVCFVKLKEGFYIKVGGGGAARKHVGAQAGDRRANTDGATVSSHKGDFFWVWRRKKADIGTERRSC